MNETKTFDLRTLLTVTTGRLLTKSEGPRDNGIGHLYRLLGWMTNDSPMTHQLPRFSDECKPWLLRWFPELGNAPVDKLDLMMEMASTPESGIDGWAHFCVTAWGMKAEYDVPRIPADDHTPKHPIQELLDMGVAPERIIGVVVPEDGQ